MMDTEEAVKTEKRSFFIRMVSVIGPGVVLLGNIVGPGTVTTASSTGANNGYLLLWCCALSAFFAYVFNEPSLRWTLKTGTSMLEGVRTEISPVMSKITYIAIFSGAIAYQTGNFLGASLALNYLVPGLSVNAGVVILALFTVFLAIMGRYKALENTASILVAMMLIAFVVTMFACKPSLTGVANGFIPRIPHGAEILAMGLVGTTVCPDNVFAMSTMTKNEWHNGLQDLGKAKKDLRINMVLCGLITCAICICAATVLHPQGLTVSSAADMAKILVPFVGRYAGVLFALGLWAAGFSSAIYFTGCFPEMFAESFGKEYSPKSIPSRAIIFIVALFPIVVCYAFSGTVPTSIIITAQVLCTLILPVSIVMIAILMNKRKILGEMANTVWQNICLAVLGLLVLGITINAAITIF
ncbi:MAG: Nramp family divalent metal transporter [Eubacteriaceae bacterium]|jgi:NRAMP (natural resistance-associated macrophage protein)-like metal ion transporter|nr:Nramp family divalent metal transporter [Eubacteriaceae bacterium]